MRLFGVSANTAVDESVASLAFTFASKMTKKQTKSSRITHPIGAIELVMRLAIGVAIVLGLAHIGLLVKTEIDKRMHLRSVMASLERIENQEKGGLGRTNAPYA